MSFSSFVVLFCLAVCDDRSKEIVEVVIRFNFWQAETALRVSLASFIIVVNIFILTDYNNFMTSVNFILITRNYDCFNNVMAHWSRMVLRKGSEYFVTVIWLHTMKKCLPIRSAGDECVNHLSGLISMMTLSNLWHLKLQFVLVLTRPEYTWYFDGGFIRSNSVLLVLRAFRACKWIQLVRRDYSSCCPEYI